MDVGCGTGVMTQWLAEQTGPNGTVTAIDNNESQVNATMKRIHNAKLSNVRSQVLSAYDLKSLDQKFDLVYCRFLLHHLQV